MEVEIRLEVCNNLPAERLSPIVRSSEMEPSQKTGDSGAESSNNGNNANASFSLFVGNLAFATSQDALRQAFEECGPISDVRIVTDRNNGRSKGYGYVDFQTQAALEQALSKGDVNLDGRPLRLDHANAKPSRREPTDNGGARARGVAREPSPTLFVGNLSYDATEETVKEALANAGNIKSVRIITNRGFGYVEFEDVEAAKRAIEQVNGTDIGGRQIRLDYAGEQGSPSSRGGRGGRGGRGRGGRGGRGGPRGRGNFSRGGRGGGAGGRF